MTARPLASLLAHLDGDRRAFGGASATRVEPSMIEAAAEAARCAGYAEGLAEGERRLAGERLRAGEALASQLQQARDDWTGEESDRIAARLKEAFAEIEGRLVEAVAATLRPVLAARIAEAAVARMAEEIRRLLGASSQEAAITLSAPADLLIRLRSTIGDDTRIDYVESDGVDAQATLGRARIETRLSAWAEWLAREV